MKAIAIDPGETTGIASYNDNWNDWNARLWCEHVPGAMDALTMIRKELSLHKDVIIIEEFRISAGTARKSRAGSNTAIEIIGAVKWLAHCDRIPVVMQTPSDVMGFMTNDKLRRLGWYVPNEHARDAVRHLAYYLIESRTIPAERVLA